MDANITRKEPTTHEVLHSNTRFTRKFQNIGWMQIFKLFIGSYNDITLEFNNLLKDDVLVVEILQVILIEITNWQGRRSTSSITIGLLIQEEDLDKLKVSIEPT